MSQSRERQRKKQRDISQSSQLQEQVASQVARPEQAQPASSTVAQLQDTFGNQFVLEALSQQAQQGPTALAAEAIQMGIAGVDAQDIMPGTGSMSVLRAQLHADMRSRGTPSSTHTDQELERTVRRAGRPLPPAVRARMEAAFGHDFSHVRIHTDAAAARAAADIQARAFAVGSDVFFGAGIYAPDTHQGLEVLAHELAHVEQADQGRLPAPTSDGLSISTPTDKAEVEAVSRARVITSNVNTLSAEELIVAAPPAMQAAELEADQAESSRGASTADAPVMRDARGALGGLSRQLRDRRSRSSGGSSRRRSRPPSRGGSQARGPSQQQPEHGRRPERRQDAPQRTTPDASELLADALATAIVTILPPADEQEQGEQGERRGGAQRGPSQQSRGGQPGGGRPQRGGPGGARGEQAPQGPSEQGEQGPEAELDPQERLEQFITGQIIEPAVAEVGVQPEHVQQALSIFRPREQEQVRGQAQQQPIQGPDVLLGMVPEALERAAPVLDQLRAEAGEGGVQRPDTAEVDQARTASPEAEAATPPVVAPEPTPSTEPGPSSVPQTTTTPSAAAPVQEQRPAGELSPAEEAAAVDQEQDELEEVLEEAEQEAEEAAAAAADDDQEPEEAEPVPTGRGRVSSAQQSYEEQRDYLEAEIHKVEIDLEWNETDLGTTGGKLTGKQDRIGDTQGQMDDNADRRDSRRELVEERAEAARAQNKPPQPPEKDGQLRFHDLKAKRYPQEMKGYERDVNKLKDETDKLNAEQERLNELMQQLQDELNAPEPPSSGGGAQGPENVPKICEKLSESITRKTTETQRTVDTLTRETEELQTRVDDLTSTLSDLETEASTAYRDWQGTQDDLDAVDTSLASTQSTLATTDGTAGGQSTPTSSTGDNSAQCTTDERSGLEALLDSLETAWRTEIPARQEAARAQKATAETELRTKTTELTEATEEIRLMELAVTTLEGGTLLYEQIAARFGLNARRYFYPPGHRPWNPDDEFRTEEQMEAERQLFAAQTEQTEQNTETDDATGPVSLQDATATDRERDNRTDSDSDSDSSTSTQTAAQRREERERQEQQQQDALVRDISAARNMPPDERARRLEALGAGQSPRKTPAQLAAMLDQQYSDTGTAIAAQQIQAPITQSAEEQQRMAETAGVSVEALQRWSEEQVRRDHQVRAARYLGMPAEQSQEAADRLATLGAARGMSGTELLNHLAFVPLDSLSGDPELASLAEQVRTAAADDPDFASARPDGMSVAAWREQQEAEARTRQGTIDQTRGIADSLGVSFGEVDGYVASMASASGVDPNVIRTQLQQGGPAAGQGQTMSADQINTELERIHLLTDPNQRATALAALNGQVPIQQLMGAMLANGEDGNGLVEGPVANQQLDARLDAIASMPMQQQWEAYANLSRMTGMAPDSLMRAQRNRDTRDTALNGVSEIRANNDLSPQERTRRLEELAQRMNLTVQQLNDAYEQTIIATQAALARAAGRNVAQGPRQPGDPLTQNLFEDVDPATLSPTAQAIRELQAGNLSGNDAERKIMQVAAATGLDPADVRRFTAVATMEHNQREWGERLGMEGPEATRQLTTWAEQRGITPAEMLDHLRRLPPDQCPPDMRAAQRNLQRWDTQHAGAEDQHSQDVDELARQRAAAGLHGNASFHRIITNPADIDAIEDPAARRRAREEYNDYCAIRDEFINEMDETCVDDDDAISILRRMTPAQRAALMADPAAVDEDNYHPLEAYRNGVSDEELTEGVGLLNQATAYNRALDTGVQERVQEATRDALELEQRTQQTLRVAESLGTTDGAGVTTPVSTAEANARIDALAMHNNVSREEAVRLIRTAPDPQALFAPLFTVNRSEATRPDGSRTTRVQPSQAFRQELTRVNALPAAERRDALARLQALTGLSDDDMHDAQGELTVENHVVQTLHQARELPEQERQRVMERLEEQTGRTSSELQSIYTRVQEEDRTALSRAPQATAHIQRLRDCAIGDLQTNAEEVARQTGMPVDVVLRLAQADRSQQPGRSVASFVGTDNASQENFLNEAYRRNMSSEEFADYLARSPAGELPFELRALRQQVLDAGYTVQHTESEQEQRRRALGDPTDPAYIRQRDILMGQLTHDCTDEIILGALNAMTPAQRRMFFQEWEARRLAGGRIGGGDSSEEMQPIEDQLRDALQGGDEDRGLALLAASNEFDPEASLTLDVHEPRFTGLRNSLLREIQPPGQPDPDNVRYWFEQMTPAQRAQFLRDQDDLINAATAEKRDGQRTDAEIPVRIDTLMRGDDGFQVMLHDAQRMNQDPNTVRLRDEARTRASEVETRVRETDRAIEALNWEGDRNQAYELLQSMSRDYQLSNENMLRMLEGRELVDDSDQTPEHIRRNLRTAPSERRRRTRGETGSGPSQAERSATQRESRGDALAGYTMDSQQVTAHAAQLQSFLDGEFPRPTPRQVADMLQGCNPRELSELDRRLQPGGLEALTQSRRDANGRYLPRIFGPAAVEVNSLQRRAEDYRAVEREDALVLELSANDPRSQIDPSTPDGLAQRMAWARGLPPEQRVAELNRLQGQLRRDGPVDMASTIAQAYLGGSLGGSSQVMRPALLAQVQAAQNLPPTQRDAQLAMLARLSGHTEVRELEQAASRSQANLRALTEFQRVEDLPESERLAEISRICASSGMSEGELRLLLEQAENSGVLDRPLQDLSPEAEVELDRIKDITDPDERRLALDALGREYGLTTADMIAHLNQQATDARQEGQRRVAAERQAEEIAEKIRGGDEDEIRAIMQRYGNDPENFQRILREYPGGVEALQRALRSEFGGNDPDNIDFLDMIDRAEDFTPAPELPAGVPATVSRELRDLMQRFPESTDPEAQRRRELAMAEFKLLNGLSEAAFTSVQAHAEHTAEVFDEDVERRKRMIEAEVNSLYVDDDRMREIIMGSDPELLHALMERYPQLMQDALDGTGGDTYEDIEQQMEQSRQVMGLPYDQRADRIQEMRVEYKAAQLQEEFDAWFWRDPARVRELLADCSEEELRLLDQRFDGQLNQKIDEVMTPTIFQTLAVVATFIIAGPLYGCILAASVMATSEETELAAIKGNINATRTNEDGSYPVDSSKIDGAVAALREELDSTFWVSDANLLNIMTSLNPRELAALREQIEGDGPNALQVFGENGERLTFRQILEANMSGDTQAQAVALLAEAEDAANGRNRRDEMNQVARDLAIKDRMDELAKSPANRNKSPEELYRMAVSNEALIASKTQERVKKIQDSANSLFKAIDGWGDDEKEVLKTLAGLTPEEIDLVKVEYRRHFGKDLETQMREDMGLGDWKPSDGFEAGGFWESSFTDHNEGKMALMMMSKEHRAEGVREFLLEYSDRAWCEDEDLIFSTLENMSVEERTKIVTMPGAEDFLYRIKRDLGTHEAQLVDALVAVNPETGKAEANKASVAAVKMKMAIHGSGDWWDFSSWGTDENDFLEQLDGLTPEEVQQAMAYYNSNLSSGGSFQEEVMSDFGTGNAWRVIEAEMRGDKVEADVFRIEYAADGWGTDEKLIEETLAAGREGRGGRGPEHLAAVRQGFDATFGGPGGKYADRGATGQSAMDVMLGEETQGMERVYFQQMAQKGKADDEVTLLYAMQGWGTDEEKVKKVMADIGKKSPAERAAFAARFRSMSVDLLGVDQSLEEWIEGDFSGTEGFEMKLQVMGEPQTPEEYLERARMRYEFERGGLWNQLVGNTFMDGLEALGAHSNGSLLIKQMGDIEAMFGPDGKLKDPQKFDDLKELCAWEAQDAQRYRETRDKVADAVSNTIQIVGAVVVTVVTFGSGSGVLVAVIANMMVSLAATAVKAAMKGGGYGVEELGMDLANAAVSAAFAGVGALRAAGQAGAQGLVAAIKAGKKLTEVIAKQGIKSIMKEALLDLAEGGAEGLLKALINSEGALAQGDGEFLKYLLKETAMGGIKKVAVSALGKGLGKTPLGKRLAGMEAATQGTGALADRGSALAHLGLKYADSVIKGGAGVLLDHNKWEQWAKGEGVDFNLFKSIFLDSAIESILEVGARRTTAYQKYWANKNLKKAKAEGEQLWDAYRLAQKTYDDEAGVEAVFGERLQANQQAIMIGEQNLAALNKQAADENTAAIAQQQQRIQRASDELDDEGTRRLADNPEGDVATQGALRDTARLMIEGAQETADSLEQGQRPRGRRRGSSDLDDGSDTVLTRRSTDSGEDQGSDTPLRPKRTVANQDADELEAKAKTTTKRKKSVEQQLEEVEDGPERWRAFGNFEDVASEKAAILGAKAIGDDGEFDPGLKAKLEKLGYTVRKNNVIARADTGEQVPLTIQDGVLTAGLKVQGKTRSPTHLANELLPGGSRGTVWKNARTMIDQEITLDDGRTVKVTRVVPTTVRQGVDSEGTAITSRAIRVETADGEIVYRPISDFDGTAAAARPTRPAGEPDIDAAPVIRALASGDVDALTGGDPGAAAQLFANPGMRKALNQAFEDAPEAPAQRQRQVKTLLDSFDGDFMAAHQSFGGAESRSVQKALNAHRGKLVSSMITEVQEAFPGLKVKARRLDPNSPVLTFEFEGAETPHARAFLEDAARDLFGGSLEATLGVELSEAPVRMKPEADVSADPSRTVRGQFTDPMTYEEGGVTRFIDDGRGGKWGYSTAFGFTGDLDTDGAFVIRQKVILVADDLEDAGVQRVKADVEAANSTYYNDPKHRIVIDDVERPLRQELDVEIVTRQQLADRNAAKSQAAADAAARGEAYDPGVEPTVVNVNKGKGRADSSNLYTEGPETPATDQYRQMVIAHELAHAIWGLADRYEDHAQRIENPNFNPATDHPSKRWIDVQSEARKNSSALHVSTEGGLMEDFNVAYAQGKQPISAAKSWEDLAESNWKGIKAIYDESNQEMPVKADGRNYDWALALKRLNPSLADEDGSFPAIIPAGSEVVLPKLTAPDGWGVSSGNLKQLEWTIAQSKRGRVDFELGDGGAVDQVTAAEKGQSYTRPKQQYSKAAVAKAKAHGFDLDALSPSAISATRGRGKQRRGELDEAKSAAGRPTVARGSADDADVTQRLPAIGAAGADQDTSGAMAPRAPSGKADSLDLPPVSTSGLKRRVDLAKAHKSELRALGLSEDVIVAVRAHLGDGKSFDMETFVKTNAKLDPRSLGKLARITGTEDQVVAATRHPNESAAEAAHRLELDSAKYGTKVKVKGVAELHNHFKGVLDVEDFPRHMFPEAFEADPDTAARLTLATLKRMYGDDPDAAEYNHDGVLFKKDRDTGEITPTVSAALIKGILDEPGAEADPMGTLRRVMRATAEMPFDYTYDPRGALMDLMKTQGRKNSSDKRFEQFIEATVDRLARQGITYVELQGKVTTHGMLDADFQRICKKRGITVKMLPQLLTNQMAVDDDGKLQGERITRKKIYQMLNKDPDSDEPVSELIAGLDICGPEAGRWSPDTIGQVDLALQALSLEAKRAKRPMVLRPHVGEGYGTEAEIRRGGGGPDSEAAKIARNNLTVLLDQLENGGYYTPPPTGDVIVRLGHVTHATPEHIEQMKRLGVIAEVNVGSNLATGALPADSNNDGRRLDEHPLVSLMLAGIPTVLSTDAQGVMSTSMSREYGFAADILADFRAGKTTAMLNGEPVTFSKLSKDQQAALTLGTLHREAADQAFFAYPNYGRLRMGEGEGTPPLLGAKVLGPDQQISAAVRAKLEAQDYIVQKNGVIRRKDTVRQAPLHIAEDGTLQAGHKGHAKTLGLERTLPDRTEGPFADPAKAPPARKVSDDDHPGPELIGPREGTRVTTPKEGDTPLIGLANRVFDPEATAEEAARTLGEQGVPRHQRLTAEERRAESAFAGWVENDPELATNYAMWMAHALGSTDQPMFEVDAMKRLLPDYGGGKDPANDTERAFRLTQNHALHPTAVALARLGFMKRLDELEALPPDHPRRQVLVTNGGCGAGKSELDNAVKNGLGANALFGATWDAAGEGDAYENTWILQAARKRGIKVVFGFAEADPTTRYQGVLERAASKGRVVDVLTFINSYVDGATEMKRFMESPEYLQAVRDGQATAFGVEPGEVNVKAFKDKTGKEKVFPNMRVLNPDGPMEAKHMGAAADKQAALDASLRILEDYVSRQRTKGEDPTTVARGALENALKFLPDQSPEVQASILASYERIFGGPAKVTAKPVALAAKAPGADEEMPRPRPRSITEEDAEPDLQVRPARGGRRSTTPADEVELSPIGGKQGRERIEGTRRYNDGKDDDGFECRATARAARRGDDVTFNWPPGMPDADKAAFVQAVMGRLGLEVDNPDLDSFTGWTKGKDVMRARARQLEEVLFDGGVAEGGARRDLQGSTHRFTALMHIVESGQLGKLKLSDVVGAQGETVADLYGMWRRGEIGAQNAPDCFEPAKARAMVKSIRDNGYITDQAQATKAGLVDPANRGEIHGINVLPAELSGQTTAIDRKVHGWQDFVLGGSKPRTLAEWEQFQALQLADEALRSPAPKAPKPQAPRDAQDDDPYGELEITAPIPGTKRAGAHEDELEITAELPGVSPARGGFHEDITADLPAPSRSGPRATAQDEETFRRTNMNYEFYVEDVDRLLRKRPELRELADDHGLTHEEIVAIYAYSRQDYADMNAGLRGQDPEQLAAYRAQIAVTNAALAKLPAARGSVFRRVKAGDWLDDYQEGATISEKAYTSTSNDYDTMLGHAGEGSVEFVMRSRTGRDITQLSGKGELENEVLFAPGTRFRVTNRTVEDDGTIVIYMDEEQAPAARAPRAPGEQADDAPAPAAPRGGKGSKGGRRKVEDGPLDLDFADYHTLRAHGLSKKEANKIISFREQNGGLFDFSLYAAQHPDHEIRVIAPAARRSGREAEAVAAVKKPGENEAEAAQRVGIDPRDFGPKIKVHDVAELHNHFKGILEAEDFPKLLFPDVKDSDDAAAQTIGLLRQLYKDDPGGELRLPHKKQATELIEKILNSSEAETDPQHALRRMMTASKAMPFDFTYDPRGLLIDRLKGDGNAEAFVRATAKRLAEDGVSYAELQGKISTPGVSAERFQEICAEEGVKIRLLPQLLTHQFAGEDAAGFTDDKLMSLMFGDDYMRQGKVPDIVGGVDICGPEAGKWSGAGMDHLERAFSILDTEAQFSGRRLVLRPHVGEGYSGTEGQRRLGVEERSAQAATARHNLELIVSRLERMQQEGSYRAPPAGHVQVRLGHVTATTPELAQRMARLGVVAEVNVGSNLITGALPQGKKGTGDRLDQHPLPTLLYYGVKTVLSTDAQGVMSTSLPKEYGLADDIIQRFRRGESKITVPDPNDPKSSLRLSWSDLTPEQQERFDVGFLERTARGEAAAGTWDGKHRGPTGGLKIRRQRLTNTRSTTSRLTPSGLPAGLAGANRRPKGDRLRDHLAAGRLTDPGLLEELLKRAPEGAPRSTVVMNLIQSASVAFEDLMSAAVASGSTDMSEALREFQEELVLWLERELRRHHPSTRVRASGKGSSRMQLVVEGGREDEARDVLEQICRQTYGRDWERALGVQIRDPDQSAGVRR